jgi:hypothetical protein
MMVSIDMSNSITLTYLLKGNEDGEVDGDENQQNDNNDNDLPSGSDFKPTAEESDIESEEMELEEDAPDTEIRKAKPTKGKKEKKGLIIRGEVQALRNQYHNVGENVPNSNKRKMSVTAE